jgi:hypothetical protein
MFGGGGGVNCVYRVLVGKPQRTSPLGRPRQRWEDNIKMDLQEVSWGGMEWIDLVEDWDRWQALVNPYPANVENMVSS